MPNLRAKVCLMVNHPCALQRNVLEDQAFIVDPRVAANRLKGPS